MVKKLSLMRHAHSPAAPGKDFDRKLSEHGKLQARSASLFLKEHYSIDLIISSDAPRVIETSAFIEKIFPAVKIERSHSIYSGSYGDIMSFLRMIEEDYHHILLIGHNPTILTLALEIADKKQEKYEELAFSDMAPAKIITFSLGKISWNSSLKNRGIIDSIFEVK